MGPDNDGGSLSFKDETESSWYNLTGDEKADYGTLKAHMIKRMKQPGSESAMVNEYHSLTQGEGGTPALLATRMRRLVECLQRLKPPSSKRLWPET